MLEHLQFKTPDWQKLESFIFIISLKIFFDKYLYLRMVAQEHGIVLQSQSLFQVTASVTSVVCVILEMLW